MVAPRLDALRDVGAAVVQVLARSPHAEVEEPEIHLEKRLDHVEVACGEHRIVREARVLPPVAIAPTAVVGVSSVRNGEKRTVEAGGQTAPGRTANEIPLRGVGGSDGGTFLGEGCLRIETEHLAFPVHGYLCVTGLRHPHFKRHFASRMQSRRMIDRAPAGDLSATALPPLFHAASNSPRAIESSCLYVPASTGDLVS